MQILPDSGLLRAGGIGVEIHEIADRQQPILILIVLLERPCDLIIVLRTWVAGTTSHESSTLFLIHHSALGVLLKEFSEDHLSLWGQVVIGVDDHTFRRFWSVSPIDD